MDFCPLTFKPIYKEKIWGGKKLKTVFNRKLPAENIGESWELTTHANGMSVVSNGPFRGYTLAELVKKYPQEMIGTGLHISGNGSFPLLIKFLDADNKLSIQVHPDDQYARLAEGEQGKTEMWYIVNAEPGARLIYGLKPGTSKEDFINALQKGQLEKCLNEVEVKKGEVYFIPAGTIHAIEEGILIAEIQQNSDTTYRVYDWNRIGRDGKSRPLHIHKALETINFNQTNNEFPSLISYKEGFTKKYLTACPYFAVELLKINKKYVLKPDGKFYILINIKGQGELSYQDMVTNLVPGKTVFIPANLKDVVIKGRLEFLLTYVPLSRDEIFSHLIEDGFTVEDINNLPGLGLQW